MINKLNVNLTVTAVLTSFVVYYMSNNL